MKDEAAMTQRLYRSLKQLPGIRDLLQTTWWKVRRHRLTLALGQRRNCHFTCFLRLPTQFEALSGPVLDFLTQNASAKPLDIAVIGCSTGAEAYSIASVLRQRHPDRSEEHTSELQSRLHLVCRLLLEKKKTQSQRHPRPPHRCRIRLLQRHAGNPLRPRRDRGACPPHRNLQAAAGQHELRHVVRASPR